MRALIAVVVAVLALAGSVAGEENKLPAVYTNPKDGQQMLLVPAGRFTMGTSSARDLAAVPWLANSSPAHVVSTEAFYVGKYEVTAAQFRKFLAETGAKLPTWEPNNQNDTWPANTVTWREAYAYCLWAGLRLPTEAEWEKAARGIDGRKWPWGSTWDPALCNSRAKEDRYAWLAPAGSFPGAVSPYGCLDMAGNVWEWTSTLFRPYPYNAADGRESLTTGGPRVLRGGSCDAGGELPPIHPSAICLTFMRGQQAVDTHSRDIGFRCAISAAATQQAR